MNLLIDINHPAHVHLFRNAAKIWQARGHRVIFAARRRDIVPALLEGYGFDYHIASTPRKGLLGMAVELLEHDWQVLRLARQYQVDLMLGTSASICHVARITPARAIYFDEDDAYYQKEFIIITHPFADTIVCPEVIRDKKTPKHVTYPGYHELAYLHPNQFTPDPSILDELGVQPGEPYFIVRLVALKAHHDLGHRGISPAARQQLLDMLLPRGRVFITVEGDIPEAFKPYQMPIAPHRIHDAMAYAAMLISDSQTMTLEAGVLGVPNIRCNTFVGMCSVIEELEHKYQLTHGFLPKDEARMFAQLEQMLDNPHLAAEWQARRARMLAEKIDLTAWMVDFVENYRKK